MWPATVKSSYRQATYRRKLALGMTKYEDCNGQDPLLFTPDADVFDGVRLWAM